MLWMIQDRNSLKELLATLIKPELSGSCRHSFLHHNSYVFLDRKYISQVPRTCLVGSELTHCSSRASYSPPLSACAVGAIPQEAADKLLHIHGQGTLQAHEDPKDHLRFICCLSVIRAPKAKPLVSLKLKSVTQPYNCAVWGFCQWQFAEHKQ